MSPNLSSYNTEEMNLEWRMQARLSVLEMSAIRTSHVSGSIERILLAKEATHTSPLERGSRVGVKVKYVRG